MANDINILDWNEKEVKIPISRKIRLRDITFKNCLSMWKKFRINRKKKKLESKKEDLVGLEFSAPQLVPGKRREATENYVLNKTDAIARLESKINFLETGEHLSQEFVDSRAIKLKTLMMNNLIYNRDSLYSVKEEVAEEIMNSSYKEEKEEIVNNNGNISEADSAHIYEEVSKKLAEKEAKRKEDIAKSFTSNEKETDENDVLSQQEIESVINDNINKVNDEPIVSNEEIASAISKEMEKINVSETKKVNSFINEDGSYRLRREDIDEDFRITRFDRSKLQVNETTSSDEIEEPNIAPFNEATQRNKPEVETPRKAITEIAQPIAHEFQHIVPPTINEPMEETTKKQNIVRPVRKKVIVVPERHNSTTKLEKKHITVRVKNADEDIQENSNIESAVPTKSDVENLMARVNLLRAEKEKLGELRETAIKKASSVDETYEDVYRQFRTFANSLEADCNEMNQERNEIEQNAANRSAEIDAMLKMMEQGNAQPETKGRGK